MKNLKNLLLLCALLLVAGCASVPVPPPAQVTKPEVIPQSQTPQVVAPPVMPAQVTPPQVEIPPVPTPKVEQPQPPATSTEPAPAALVLPAPIESTNPAIIALLERVHLDSQAGKRDSAGASLERALRIEPRNPWLWHELAQLRLEQGLYAQGTSLARKSNSFAGQERRLLALNWRVIGNVRIAQGNPQEAAQAFAVATELEQIAKPEQGVVPVPTAVSGAASAPVQTTVLGK